MLDNFSVKLSFLLFKLLDHGNDFVVMILKTTYLALRHGILAGSGKLLLIFMNFFTIYIRFYITMAVRASAPKYKFDPSMFDVQVTTE